MQPQIHLIDETWIDAPVDMVAAVVADRILWPRWWPTLDLTVTRDRGSKGMQWVARSRARPRRSGLTGRAELVGTVEIWLEPMRGGVLLHHYVRLDPADAGRLSRRTVARITRGLAQHAKQVFWQLKDELEAGPRSGRAQEPEPRR